MIPVRDVIPSRRAPVVTLALLGANLAAFLALPAHGLAVGRGGLGLAVAALLFHPTWPHLVLGLLMLWIFGENVEDRLGRARFAGLYAVSAAVGFAARALVLPGLASGAVGAIAGVVGAYLVLFPRSRALMLVPLPVIFDLAEVPASYLAVAWFLVQVAVMLRVPGIGDAMVVTSAAGFLTGAASIALAGARTLRADYWRKNGV
jgi:membrane associated rhomboid family serine protease